MQTDGPVLPDHGGRVGQLLEVCDVFLAHPGLAEQQPAMAAVNRHRQSVQLRSLEKVRRSLEEFFCRSLFTGIDLGNRPQHVGFDEVILVGTGRIPGISHRLRQRIGYIPGNELSHLGIDLGPLWAGPLQIVIERLDLPDQERVPATLDPIESCLGRFQIFLGSGDIPPHASTGMAGRQVSVSLQLQFREGYPPSCHIELAIQWAYQWLSLLPEFFGRKVVVLSASFRKLLRLKEICSLGDHSMKTLHGIVRQHDWLRNIDHHRVALGPTDRHPAKPKDHRQPAGCGMGPRKLRLRHGGGRCHRSISW